MSPRRPGLVATIAALAALTPGCGDDGGKRADATGGDAGERASIDTTRRARGPAEALVTIGGRTERAFPETHCIEGRGGAYCADSVGLPEGAPRLRARPGAQVGVRLGARARLVKARLARLEHGVGGRSLTPPLTVARRDAGGRAWLVRLPRFRVPDDAVLQVQVRYRDYRGDPVVFDQRIRIDG